jgi:hypothetical protein
MERQVMAGEVVRVLLVGARRVLLVGARRVLLVGARRALLLEARRVERVWLREKVLVLVLGVFVRQARALLLKVLLLVELLLALLVEPQELEADKPGCRFFQAQAVLG